MKRHLLAIMAAVLVSNSITLGLYYLGSPTLALVASAPVGLIVGGFCGWQMNTRHS